MQFVHGEALERQVTENRRKMGVKWDKARTEVELRNTIPTGGGAAWWGFPHWAGGETGQFLQRNHYPAWDVCPAWQTLLWNLVFLLYILCSMSLCLNVGCMNRRSLSCAVFSTLGHAEEQEKDSQSFVTTSLANIWEQTWQILLVNIQIQASGHFHKWIPSWTMPIKPATHSFVISSFQFYDSILEIFSPRTRITWWISSKILTGFPSDESGLVPFLLLNRSAVTLLFSYTQLHYCDDLWANFWPLIMSIQLTLEGRDHVICSLRQIFCNTTCGIHLHILYEAELLAPQRQRGKKDRRGCSSHEASVKIVIRTMKPNPVLWYRTGRGTGTYYIIGEWGKPSLVHSSHDETRRTRRNHTKNILVRRNC